MNNHHRFGKLEKNLKNTKMKKMLISFLNFGSISVLKSRVKKSKSIHVFTVKSHTE